MINEEQWLITVSYTHLNYPEVEFIVKLLRHTNCQEGCNYCHTQLDVLYNLKAFFGYERCRTYEGEPLQERAAQAAVKGKSLLAIFPTGGGKSLTFQLPALMAGRSVHGLTVIISPLQSLMKDQVDNLADRGITAVSYTHLEANLYNHSTVKRLISNRFSKRLMVDSKSA